MEKYNNILLNTDFRSLLAKIDVKEEDRPYCCHGIEHLLDTARISYILVLENNIDISKDIIYGAALLHDLGRAVADKNHNFESRKLAEKILPECGYTENETTEICRAIENHRKTADKIENISDVLTVADHISRKCYMCKASAKCYWSEERKNHKIIY
jgi:HD superfamily phosphodiesterase